MPNQRDIEAYHSFVRVGQCIRRHPELRAKAAETTALANLDAVIAAIESSEQMQRVKVGEKVDLTTQIRDAGEALRNELRGLQGAAEYFGIQQSRGPKVFLTVNQNHSWHEHIATARAMADVARQHESALLRALPPDFIARLLNAADTLEALTAGREDAKGLAHGATKSFPALVEEGRLRVGILEGNLGALLHGALRAEFDQAKSLGRVHRAKPKQQDASQPAEAADAATAAMIEAAPPPPQALPQPPAKAALPLWSALTAFLTGRRAQNAQAEEVIDVDYTVEETKRLSPPGAAG